MTVAAPSFGPKTPLARIEPAPAGPLLGLQIVHPGPGVIERIGRDWDWIWIDAQHGDLDLPEALELVRATDLIGRPGLVRIPAHDPVWVAKSLESGAAGVIVPMVESAGQAQAMVQAAKFPPLGNRSYGGRRIGDRAGRGFYHTANTDTVLIVQVESEAAVAVAGDLAQVPGIDGLFLGPEDLTIRAGRDTEAPKSRASLADPYRIVAERCREHGKLSVGIGADALGLELTREFGYSLIVGVGAVSLEARGSQEAAQAIRSRFFTA